MINVATLLSQIIQQQMLGLLMNDELEGRGRGIFQALLFASCFVL
jgi:hypothetical protein